MASPPPAQRVAELRAAAEAWRQGAHTPDMKLDVRRRLVVLTCMDSRLLPEQILGLKQGDAEIIRNGGGRVTEDVIRSMVVCQDVLQCDTVAIIHHTDCGAHAALYNPTAVLEHAKAKADQVLGTHFGGIDMHPIYDLDQSVRDDVAALRGSPRIHPETAIFGLVFVTESGELREVCRDEGLAPRIAGAPAAP